MDIRYDAKVAKGECGRISPDHSTQFVNSSGAYRLPLGDPTLSGKGFTLYGGAAFSLMQGDNEVMKVAEGDAVRVEFAAGRWYFWPCAASCSATGDDAKPKATKKKATKKKAAG